MRNSLRLYAEARRGPCPGPAALAAYAVTGERYDEISDHISCCSKCCQRVLHETDWIRLLDRLKRFALDGDVGV